MNKREKHRIYMRKWRLAKGLHKPRDPTPPTKPTKDLRKTDKPAYMRQYVRWWRHNGNTARIKRRPKDQ